MDRLTAADRAELQEALVRIADPRLEERAAAPGGRFGF